MLLKRIIPCLDCDRGRVVKGVNFKGIRDVGDPVEIARRYEADGADELVFYDIAASHEERSIMGRRGARRVRQRLHARDRRRGIRTLEDATRLIQAGGGEGQP